MLIMLCNYMYNYIKLGLSIFDSRLCLIQKKQKYYLKASTQTKPIYNSENIQFGPFQKALWSTPISN